MNGKTHWPVHPMAMLFPAMTPAERAELKKDMMARVGSGLDPLERPILKYEDQILDGRHRDELWVELANENACDGFFQHNQPTSETFSPAKHGTLTAWMRAKSSNMVHRHIPADRRAAIFLKAAETYPDLKAAIQEIEDENAKRMTDGKPLDAGDQRGNTAKQVGELAGGAGATTMKVVKKLKREAPAEFEEVAAGNTTAKEALKRLKKKKEQKKQSHPAQAFGVGDALYQVDDIFGDNGPTLKEVVIAAIEGDEYRCGDNISISKVAALTLEGARQVRQNRIEKRIADLGAEIKKLKGALRSQPTILKAEGQAAAPIKTTRAKAPTKKHSAPLDTITIRKLKSQYGAHAVDVLDDWLEELPRKEKTLTTYRIAKPLPTAEEFKELQTAKFTTSVEHLVSSAFSEFEDLANELSDWYDSLPDNFQSGDKGCAIDEAQCTLSNLSMPDLKDNIGCLRVVHLPLTEITSRASRRDDAVERLASVVAVLRDVSDATISNDCQILIEELENAISEAEEVEFPGMY